MRDLGIRLQDSGFRILGGRLFQGFGVLCAVVALSSAELHGVPERVGGFHNLIMCCLFVVS